MKQPQNASVSNENETKTARGFPMHVRTRKERVPFRDFYELDRDEKRWRVRTVYSHGLQHKDQRQTRAS